MDTQAASKLIETIWDIGDRLKAIQRDLDAVESVIADLVEDN